MKRYRFYNHFSIDSLKIRIPIDDIEILKPELFGRYILVNEQSGAVDETYKRENYVNVRFKGVSVRFSLFKFINQKYLFIWFSSKILLSSYFNGITNNNIKLIYRRLVGLGVVHFSYDSFLNSIISDVDVKLDLKGLELKSHKDFYNFLKSVTKESSLSGVGINVFREKRNRGVEFGKRVIGTPTKPFFKLYSKSLEFSQTEFAREFLSDDFLESQDFINMLRVEFTLKNKKFFDRFGLGNNVLSDFLDVLEFEQDKIRFVLRSYFDSWLKRLRFDSVSHKDIAVLSLTDTVLFLLLSELSGSSGLDVVLVVTSILSKLKNMGYSRSEVSRMKKRLFNIISDSQSFFVREDYLDFLLSFIS